MNYNKYQQTEKDFVRYCNQNDITIDPEYTEDRYKKIYHDILVEALDEVPWYEVTDQDIIAILFGHPRYFAGRRRGFSQCFGMKMKRRDSKVCLNVIRRLGLVNFCSIYRNYDVIWEPQKDMNRKQEIRRTLHELAEKIIEMNESKPVRLQMYATRYHLSYSKEMAKEISKFNDAEAKEANSFHLTFHILRGIIHGMREELIRSGYWEE